VAIIGTAPRPPLMLAPRPPLMLVQYAKAGVLEVLKSIPASTHITHTHNTHSQTQTHTHIHTHTHT